MILDASTDDSFAANGNRPAIVLDGNNTGSAGLTLTASGSTVRGFVIRDFNSGGITINSANNTIVGNWIGSYNADGSDAGGTESNVGHAIRVTTSGNVIGGSSALDRNVIGGNDGPGIFFFGMAASSNVMIGNYIGTDPTGTQARGNNGSGSNSQCPGPITTASVACCRARAT